MIGIYKDSQSTSFPVYSYDHPLVVSGVPSSTYVCWNSSATGSINYNSSYTNVRIPVDTGIYTEIPFSISGSYAILYGESVRFKNSTTIEFLTGTIEQCRISMCLDCSSLLSVNLPFLSRVSEDAFRNCESLQTVNLPGVTSVSRSAFYDCTNLKTVNLPMCSYIGHHAFDLCHWLSYVSMPNCEYIGNNAFAYCRLVSVNLPECEKIDALGFYVASELKRAYLPKCSYIGQGAFGWCSKLSEIILLSSSVVTLGQTSTTTSDGEVFNKTKLARGVGHVYVPSSLVSAYKVASGWSSLASIIDVYPLAY